MDIMEANARNFQRLNGGAKSDGEMEVGNILPEKWLLSSHRRFQNNESLLS